MDIYIDGSSLGNPGEAGVGVIFMQDGSVVQNISRYIGEQTNNVAEYTALVVALRQAQTAGVKTLNIHSDSELLCRQITGKYKVRHPRIRELFLEAKSLLGGFQTVNICQIPREENRGADKLARLAAKDRSSFLTVENRHDSCSGDTLERKVRAPKDGAAANNRPFYLEEEE